MTRILRLIAVFVAFAGLLTVVAAQDTHSPAANSRGAASPRPSAFAEDPEQPVEPEETPEDVLLDADHSLFKGQYRKARRLAERLRETAETRARGLWIDARVILESRDPREAVALLDEAGAARGDDLDLLYEWGRALLATGRYTDAEATGERMKGLAGSDPRGHWIKGEAIYQQGRHADARKVLDEGARAGGQLAQPKKDEQNYRLGEQQLASGWCAFRINDLHIANTRFNDARDSHQHHWGAMMALARLFYETNKDESARGNYCLPVIEKNANYAEAYYWSSLTHAFRWNGGKARKDIDKAIRINRSFVPALASRAAYFISNDDYEGAARDIGRALEINPNALDALAAQALLAKTLGKDDEYRAIEGRVLAFNRAPGEFYLAVADGLATRMRFADAVDIYRKGIEAQADLYLLHRGMGQTLLNMGRNDEGKAALRTALDKDILRNNVHTRNLLTLLDSYAANFKAIDFASGNYRLLIHKSEESVMAPYYERFLERTRAELSAKYLGFQPSKPIAIEAFHVMRDFSVRTVGIEGLPALGACFGNLVTLLGPAAREPGQYNWASTTRHEMDHVYQLQMSNGQCPRWLAEGCSVYEERRCRPEWERHMEEQLYQTYVSNKLPKVAEFNEWFRDSSRMLFAYYLGSIMVEFIVESYGGYGPVIAMIQEFAKKKTPDEVFRETLHIDTAEFDRRFREHVGKKVSAIKLLPAVEIEEFDDLQELAEDGEASTDELVRLARAHYQKGSFADARMWAGLANKRGVDTKELNYTLGFLARTDPKLTPEQAETREKEFLTKAINQGLEDYNLYMRMAAIAEKDKNNEAVIFYLNEARRAFPTNPAPLRQLYAFYRQQQDEERAEVIAEQAVMLNENDIQTRGWLLQRYEAQGDAVKAADMALQIIYCFPYIPGPHKSRADAMRELEDWDESLFEWDMLRRVYGSTHYKGEDRREGEVEALLGMARTYYDMGQIEDAKARIHDAKALSPTDHRVIEMLAELEGDDTEDHYE